MIADPSVAGSKRACKDGVDSAVAVPREAKTLDVDVDDEVAARLRGVSKVDCCTRLELLLGDAR